MPGTTWVSSSQHCTIGKHPSNELVLADRTVSRFHCEIRVDENRARVRDLDSRNGTLVDGVPVHEAFLRAGSLLKLGHVLLRFDFLTDAPWLPISTRSSFGGLVGRSVAMRTTFTLLERAASSDITVLLQGETGTGKGVAAEAIHQLGTRRNGPLVVVDCGAIPCNLLESELFGHEKGAFTGADRRRAGAFELAAGGTIFLDEIGELPQDLQPKLLRVLDSGEFQCIGGVPQRADVRVVAATNRDLRTEMSSGRFRSDLFFRLAVMKIAIPPLRERPDDIGPLVEQILRSLGATAEQLAALHTPEVLRALLQSAWPGNVRELRNHLERCLVFGDFRCVAREVQSVPVSARSVDVGIEYAEARRRALEKFELEYAQALLSRHNGKVAEAAAAAGIDRVYLYRILRRHGIKPKDPRNRR
jgi:two-component system response regulator GlrR